MKLKLLSSFVHDQTPTTAALSHSVALWWRGKALLCSDWTHSYLCRWFQRVHASSFRFEFVVLDQIWSLTWLTLTAGRVSPVGCSADGILVTAPDCRGAAVAPRCLVTAPVDACRLGEPRLEPDHKLWRIKAISTVGSGLLAYENTKRCNNQRITDYRLLLS